MTFYPYDDESGEDGDEITDERLIPHLMQQFISSTTDWTFPPGEDDDWVKMDDVALDWEGKSYSVEIEAVETDDDNADHVPDDSGMVAFGAMPLPGVEFVGPDRRKVQCNKCGEVWSPICKPNGGGWSKDWWHCPRACNATWDWMTACQKEEVSNV